MRLIPPVALLLSVATPVLLAQEEIDEFARMQLSTPEELTQIEAPPPEIEAAKTVNESNGFLKEREPEMTAEEYALYEKVVSMLENNSAFALKMLESMMGEKKAPSPAFEFILGNTYYAAGRNDQAERLYRRAIDRFPTFLRAWNNLGILYYTSGRYSEAITCFSRAVVLGDRDPKTLGLLGYCLEQSGDIVSAEMSYIQALAGDPSGASWKEGLLRIYIQGRQFGRAESLVRSLIKERPSDTRFWLAYANILVSDQRKLKAMALLEIVTQAELAGTQELSLLGDLYAEQGLHAEAIATYARLRDTDGALGEQRLLRLAQALAATGQRAEAQSALDSLHDRMSDTGRVQAMQIRADLLAAGKDWPAARRTLEQLIALAPTNGRAWLAMGNALLAEEDLDRAQLAFESALRDEATAYRAHLQLANLGVKNRRYGRAVEHLQEALRLEDSTNVRDYLSRIQNLLIEEGATTP